MAGCGDLTQDLNAPGALRQTSATVTRRIMIASAGSSELGVVVPQTTH